MSFLEWIDDKRLEDLTKKMMNVASEAQSKADKEVSKNVVDPFSPIFEMGGFDYDKKPGLLLRSRGRLRRHYKTKLVIFTKKFLGL